MIPSPRQLTTHVRRLAHLSLAELTQLWPEFQTLPLPMPLAVRERIFSPLVTFWLFLSQVLSENGSCRESVRKVLAWLLIQEGKTASPGTSAYCQARQRLPESLLEEICGLGVRHLEGKTGPADRWWGRTVKVVDGSSVSMPDTPENQKLYPQPKTQKPGCGFPVMRLVAVFSLATGAILAVARSALSVGETTLLRQLEAIFQAGDVL
jgi:hypothetical protein